MSYSKFEIIRPLYSMTKKISAPSLKIGDRFIYAGHDSLLFKTNIKPQNGKYLCCDEVGLTKWIDGEEKVKRINGIVMELNFLSKKFKAEYFKQEENGK